MILKHKLKFILAVLKGDVNKVTEIEKPVFIVPEFNQTMNLVGYVIERKKYLERLIERKQDQIIKEEIDKEYLTLEQIEKIIEETWQTKI